MNATEKHETINLGDYIEMYPDRLLEVTVNNYGDVFAKVITPDGDIRTYNLLRHNEPVFM